MELSLGFVAICLSEHDCSPAKTVTAKQVESLSESGRRFRILEAARKNLTNTLRIMWFLKAHHIAVYRISANMVPLATHDVTRDWAWWEEPELREVGEKIGRVARQSGYRLSSHLPEVCGFSSRASYRWTDAYLTYHRKLFELMGLDETCKIVIHAGGGGGHKEKALATAREHLDALDDWSKERVILENGDRGFTFEDVVRLGEETGLPPVFDWHHHVVHPGDGAAHTRELLKRAFALWRDRPPKVHLSSPRSERNPRAHADYVDPEFVRPFWQLVEEVAPSALDVMVEAKMKDLAMFRLREELKALRGPGSAGAQSQQPDADGDEEDGGELQGS